MPALIRSEPYSPDPEINEILTVVIAVICGVNRFYAENPHLPNPRSPRLKLLNRITSSINCELAFFKLDRRYAPDLVYLGDNLDAAICGRRDETQLIALDFTPGRLRTFSLRKVCPPYRIGICFSLKSRSCHADWFTGEEPLRQAMEQHFPRWSRLLKNEWTDRVVEGPTGRT